MRRVIILYEMAMNVTKVIKFQVAVYSFDN